VTCQRQDSSRPITRGRADARRLRLKRQPSVAGHWPLRRPFYCGGLGVVFCVAELLSEGVVTPVLVLWSFGFSAGGVIDGLVVASHPTRNAAKAARRRVLFMSVGGVAGSLEDIGVHSRARSVGPCAHGHSVWVALADRGSGAATCLQGADADNRQKENRFVHRASRFASRVSGSCSVSVGPCRSIYPSTNRCSTQHLWKSGLKPFFRRPN
jgi:hypothetical protein